MRSDRIGWRMVGLLCAVVGSTCLAETASDSAQRRDNGEALWTTHCVSCHGGAMLEAPRASAFRLFTPERIVSSLTSGIMSVQGLPLARSDMQDVALFLTGRELEERPIDLSQAYCENAPAKPRRETAGSRHDWTSWGSGSSNARYQADEQQLSATTAQQLRLKWAFAFPETTRMRAQPTVLGDTIYIGSQSGRVYALDRDTACIRWVFQADAEVRGAISAQLSRGGTRQTLYFGDFKANAYAVDASSGEGLWKTQVHPHPLATITGSVTVGGERLFVPVSSSEVVPAAQSQYPCCSFRGAVAALDLEDGTLEWRTYTTDEPTLRGKTSAGTDRFGPSGAPIWSTPSFDEKRDLVIVTTGQNYSSPATGTSDAVLALEAATGHIRWVTQVTANDAWNGACGRKRPNCPEEDGPDFDIGAAAILLSTPGGRDLLLVGQKSGLVYGLDAADNGKLLWTTRVGRGGTMGGVHWGMSSDGEKLYVGISDQPTGNRYAVGDPFPGVHALDPESGAILWRKPVPRDCPENTKFLCHNGISAAVSSSPGLVYAGGLDGVLRVFDARDGSILWSHSTARSYGSVTGIDGRGGAIESDGPVISDGDLFITSGYDKWAEEPGNVLLAFTIDDQASQAKRE